MSLNPLEVTSTDLLNLGEQLTVDPPTEPSFLVQMLVDEDAEPAQLGGRYGYLATIQIFCEPTDATMITRGTTLTRSDGTEYKVCDLLYRSGYLTQILVNR